MQWSIYMTAKHQRYHRILTVYILMLIGILVMNELRIDQQSLAATIPKWPSLKMPPLRS